MIPAVAGHEVMVEFFEPDIHVYAHELEVCMRKLLVLPQGSQQQHAVFSSRYGHSYFVTGADQAEAVVRLPDPPENGLDFHCGFLLHPNRF
jgi:hypothetical protein